MPAPSSLAAAAPQSGLRPSHGHTGASVTRPTPVASNRTGKPVAAPVARRQRKAAMLAVRAGQATPDADVGSSCRAIAGYGHASSTSILQRGYPASGFPRSGTQPMVWVAWRSAIRPKVYCSLAGKPDCPSPHVSRQRGIADFVIDLLAQPTGREGGPTAWATDASANTTFDRCGWVCRSLSIARVGGRGVTRAPIGVPAATGDRDPSGVRRIHGVVWLRPIRSAPPESMIAR
jgi:hypothetical protein